MDYPNGKPLGLSDSEAAEGLILLCQAHARSELVLETFEVTAADLAVVKRLPCRIERAERWSHDVMSLCLCLRLSAAERFEFKPGQYIDILLSGGRRGVAAARLSFDSFDYAPDSPARQRTMTATKS